jgi:hypothetical protein
VNTILHKFSTRGEHFQTFRIKNQSLMSSLPISLSYHQFTTDRPPTRRPPTEPPTDSHRPTADCRPPTVRQPTADLRPCIRVYILTHTLGLGLKSNKPGNVDEMLIYIISTGIVVGRSNDACAQSHDMWHSVPKHMEQSDCPTRLPPPSRDPPLPKRQDVLLVNVTSG